MSITFWQRTSLTIVLTIMQIPAYRHSKARTCSNRSKVHSLNWKLLVTNNISHKLIVNAAAIFKLLIISNCETTIHWSLAYTVVWVIVRLGCLIFIQTSAVQILSAGNIPKLQLMHLHHGCWSSSSLISTLLNATLIPWLSLEKALKVMSCLWY